MRLRALFIALCVALLVACSGESSDDARRTAEPVSSAQQKLVPGCYDLSVSLDTSVDWSPARQVVGQWQLQGRFLATSSCYDIGSVTVALDVGDPSAVSLVRLKDGDDPQGWFEDQPLDQSGAVVFEPPPNTFDMGDGSVPHRVDLYAMFAPVQAPSAATPPRSGDQIALKLIDMSDGNGDPADLQGSFDVGPYTVHPSLITVGVPSGSPSLVNGVNAVTFKLDVSGAPSAAVRQLVFDLVPSSGVSVNLSGVTYPFTFNGINIGTATSGAALFSTLGATNRTGVAFSTDRPVSNGTIYTTVRFNASGVVSGSTVTLTPHYATGPGALKLTSFGSATGITATPAQGGPGITWSSLWTDSSESLPGGVSHKTTLPTRGDYWSFDQTGSESAVAVVLAP